MTPTRGWNGRRGRRRALYGALLLAVVAVLPAHVTIVPGEVRANSNQRFTVRVPTERPVPTIAVRLELPAGLGAPRLLTKPGWTYEMEKDAAGAVTAITWTGGEIGPDELDEFAFNARVPATPGTLKFRAVQTYKGGEVVAWEMNAGEQRPAPIVEVRDSTFGMAAAPEGQAAAGDADDDEGGVMEMLPLGLSILAVVLAGAALMKKA